ncbi:MAG: SNF2-related protein [Turicibacter sp.]|nr:SNF2-related protein [Turicibacter sp.]
MNFSTSKILELCANEDAYTRGEISYREGKLASLNSHRNSKHTVVRATIKGNYRNYDVTLRFDLHGDLLKYRCNCASQSIWSGACKHIVVALFAISAGHIPATSKGVVLNEETLTDTLEKFIFQEIDDAINLNFKSESNRYAKLKPYFTAKGDGVASLTFYVGYSRMYTIKSLTKFLQAVSKKEIVRYGNGLEFNHDLSSFTASSRRWISFLKQEEEVYAEMVKRIKTISHMATYEESREIALSRRNMDIFFELCFKNAKKDDSNVFINGEMGEISFLPNEDRLLQLTTDFPHIKLKAKYGMDEITLTSPEVAYQIIKGRNYYYFLMKNTIHRMLKADAKILTHILDMINVQSKIVLSGFAAKRFLSAVIPKLVSMGILEDTLSPKLKTELYFDLEDSDVVGRIIFNYSEDRKFDAFDDQITEEPKDTANEYAVRRYLEGMSFVSDPKNQVFRLSGSANIFAFIGDNPSGIDELQKLKNTDIYVTDKLKRKTINATGAKLGVRLKGQILDVSLENADFTLSELVEALDAYRAKKSYYKLEDGRLLSLTDVDVMKLADSLLAINAEGRSLQNDSLYLPMSCAPYLDSFVSTQNQSFKKLIKQFTTGRKFAIPEELTNIMRPYQQIGYQWLKNIESCGFGGILADDMGLGKTLQVLAVLLKSDLTEQKALVVAPTSLIYNWAAEIEKFAPDLVFDIVAGNQEKRSEILANADVDVFITTYDTMKRDADLYEKYSFKYVIADEAQNIKNPETKNAKGIKAIKSEHRLALTGTPIENNLTELWSLFDFVMPGYLHNTSKFTKFYEIPIIKDNDREKATQLKKQIAPFILRRLKSNVLSELPPKTETTLVAEMLPEQRKIYTAHLLKAKGELNELLSSGSLKTGRMQILAQLTRLRQICCHPSLCLEGYDSGSGKLDLAIETLQIAIESGHRVLLFSQFTKMLAILKKALTKENISYLYLDGATSATTRIEDVNRFNSGYADVFLISLKAGGTGLNLTGADIVIHYDPWWNPSVMDQASDRTHRIGQKKAVQVFNLVAMQSLEERIMALQAKKRKLIDNVINNNETDLTLNALSDAEIRELLD